jgi:hypothetical protein
MFRGYLDRLLKACAFKHVKACDPLLRFGEWPIRLQDLAVSSTNSDQKIVV